jgi:hypothetical protein
MPRAPKAPQKAAQVATEDEAIVYDADGTPCCPRHNKPLAIGPWGYYCQTAIGKGEPQEWKNRKGYCNFRGNLED